ncbi:MAG: hypothetical protein ACYC91_00885 [Solirubrobacteraceae bacterium]
MRSRRQPAQELRATIDGLPLEVRQAVLEGIKHQRIIAGAHADGAGGVCPMVAADVCWQSIDRASVARAQEAARAWDRYAEATNAWHPATRRQLLALRAMLEASILEQTTSDEMSLGQGIAASNRAKSRRAAMDAPPVNRSRSRSRVRTDTGERDRTSELREREGWSWSRAFRSYDDYEALHSLLELHSREASSEPLAR